VGAVEAEEILDAVEGRVGRVIAGMRRAG
jgi:hypothetical protein